MHKIAQIPKIIYPSESKNKRKESDFMTGSLHSSKPLTYLTVPSGQSNANQDQQIPSNIANNLFSGNQGINNQTSGGGIRGVITRFVSGNWAGWYAKINTYSLFNLNFN